MKIEITLYREDIIVPELYKTLDIGLINSANFNIPYEEWLKADKISFVDDDGCCLVLKER